MKLCRLAATLIASWLAFASSSSAAEPPPAEKTGLPLGQKAPAFTLKDQSDRDLALAPLLKEGPVAVVFYRSADW